MLTLDIIYWREEMLYCCNKIDMVLYEGVVVPPISYNTQGALLPLKVVNICKTAPLKTD